jgi:hypothetical protein
MAIPSVRRLAAGALSAWILLPSSIGAQRTVGTVASADGRLEIFYTRSGTGGGVFHTWQTRKLAGPDAWEWAPWVRYDPIPDPAGLVALRDSAGRIIAAWLSQGSIWVAAASAPGAGLQSPRKLDTHGLRSLIAVSNQDGRVEFLALNDRGQLWSVAQSAVGSWESPNVHFLEGNNLQQIAAAAAGDGRLAVVALGADRRAYWRAQNAPNSGWGPWSGLYGEGLQEVTLARNADGRLEVVALGGDGAVYHRYQNIGGGWSTWESLAGGTLKAPTTIAANADGRLDLFARRANGSQMAHVWQTAPNAKWTESPTGLGLSTLPDDQAVTSLEGKLTLVTAEKATCLVAVAGQTAPNGAFGGWPGIPSPCTAQPATIAAPKVAEFKAEPDLLPVGNTTTISWTVSNCGAGCDVSLEGRNDLNYTKIFLTANKLPAQGSQPLTPGDTFSKLTLTARSAGGVDSKTVIVQLTPNQSAPACSSCSWFYFKMTPPSTLVSCVNVAYFAGSESAGRQTAEAEWDGYKATAITYQQFVAGCK